MYVDLYMLKIWLLAGCGSIYVENMIVAGCKDSIENMTIGIFVEFEKKKKWLLERNDKKILNKIF